MNTTDHRQASDTAQGDADTIQACGPVNRQIWMRISEAAESAGVSRMTIRRRVMKGVIRRLRVLEKPGMGSYVRRADVTAAFGRKAS